MEIIRYEDLVTFHKGILTHVGLDEETADAVTTGLCETSLRGVDSHGVRLLPHYVNSALMGRKNPKPNYKFSKKFPTIGTLDADNTFGHAAGMKAIDYCIEMAEEYGMGVVGVQNSSHPGAMASFALKAARQGYMAFAFTQADALILSYNGKRPFFGTNPICFAAPRLEDEPFCLDMAPSMISWNKLLMYKNENEKVPENYTADSNGRMTTNPDEASCLMPIGNYKGFGLASMGDILCGVFTGMTFGRNIPSMYKASMNEPRHLGQFYLVMKADGCIDHQVFVESLQQMTDEVRSEDAQAGEQVMLPGDPQKHETEIRKKNGIPLDQATVKEFQKLAEQYDVPLRLL